jgi:hypothetical protein
MMRLFDHRLGLGDNATALCLRYCNNHTMVQPETQVGGTRLYPSQAPPDRE